MTTAGIAAASPNAVARSASAIPGATIAKLVVCDFDMPIKLFMMPHTVPNSPANGAVAPMVASTPVPRLILRLHAASIRSKRDAIRSLTPSLWARASADSRNSATAASRNSAAGYVKSDDLTSDNDVAGASDLKAVLTRRLATTISIDLASQTVQVTTEANAR